MQSWELLTEPTCIQVRPCTNYPCKLMRLVPLSDHGFSKYVVWTLTFSTANVLITYSASSSVSIRVTLMSLYISVSSGQYLQHLTFRKHKGNQGFRVFFYNSPDDGSQYDLHDKICAQKQNLSCTLQSKVYFFRSCMLFFSPQNKKQNLSYRRSKA